ncbi:transcription factor Gibbin [Seriola aureovittata]|uniref:transcription factor Gibbin n=1 Tax=Seriola aureovittata TaxID=2871759 RepID=UPI0024BD931D|nr:transcription factor Gibbin [Seriola aureovittata]XP_056255990.1 transcription factor Gibbin [Seriola aureovittata]XP_056255991.1 transcription factor Gibbin [Seriola aureovittata]XP_056255992.1 transcription factor Gibbin [Seriola aureovittata]XP_056255993.1 transcription factor Gibbin [Seriola aureovittata]
MSGLSDQLFSGQSGAPVGCGGDQAEEKGCVGGLEELERPELWTRELGFQAESQDPSNDGLAPVTSDHFPPSSPSALANGLHLQRRLGHNTCRRRQTETHTTAETHTFAETFRNMQTHIDPDVHAQAVSHAHMDNCGHMDINAHTGSVGPEHSRTLTPEAIHTTSPQPLSLALGNHPSSTNQLAAPILTPETDMPSTFCPVPIGPNTNPGSSPLPVEAEKKYALRSSGRPRFPCHLRKSSRLRRSIEDGEKRAVRERGGEEVDEVIEEKIWRVKEEEVAVGEKEDHKPVEAVLPTAPCPTDVALALTVPKPVPKATPKPGPRLGHKPGPKSRSRPAPKSVQKAAPKSVMKQRQAAQSIHHRVTPHHAFVNTSTIPASLLNVKEEPVAESGVSAPNNRKCGRYVGVRKIVVKVARIPVSLSRRQKSYKISNLETVTGTEKGNDGGLEGSEAVREPTALLRMKNNGKSVMVMFPPGELPVILKRRRGRPPKQPLPGIPGEPPNPSSASGNGDQPKKPRRRRRTKLPSPYPSYVNDTNDVKTEYGDVLSKLAFLNRQPPATGRCSPPRCWTPSEPESFHAPLENPGISTLLHRLTGFRRPRGGRGGGLGRGGGAAGGIGGSERNKSTFSDFFESIGKKRKLSPLSDHGLPRKRGKGVGGGGVGRGGGIVGTEPGGEKIVRKRRMRKNGAFKGEGVSMGQDWPNGAGGWGEEGGIEKEKGLAGFQLCGSPRGGFSSCEVGRGGAYSSLGGSRGVGPVGEDSQGLFAGYFRSLLDSDDSSDLLDMSSSQSDPRKASSTPGYEPSSPAAGHSWSPAFSKWCSKGASSVVEGSAQTHCSSARPPYSYGSLAQTSPTTSTYLKSTPPSLSHSPSSPHPASYGHYSSGYSSSSPAVSQRSSDCSFAYGSGHSSGKATPVGQIGYSSYQAAAKRGFCGYPAAGHSSMRGESTGPTSPGGGYMAVAKGSQFSSSSPEGYKQYNSNQWSFRQGYGGWSTDSFGTQYHGYSEYGSNESKDILDISNYTPQKAKRQPFPESLSESSSDSSHLGSVATGSGPSSAGGTYKLNEAASVSAEGGQSSLSSLEKLMMDWHESASGPSYNWSQSVLFQGGGTSKPGRGRRKRTEAQSEKEGGSALHSDSPSSPSPTPTPGPKRGGVGGRGRGSRGGRGGLSPCQRERPSGAKGRGKAVSTSGAGVVVSAGGPEGSGLFQEVLDYYSGDSSSLSPLATPNPAPPSSYLQDPCEYPSPYSAHPSTPSSEERYPALYPGESSSSLSPSVSSPPYPPKPTPPPPQSYHPVPSRTFSPSCSPSPRVTPHCGTALSPSHRPPPKDPQFSQYDSPSYCSSPYWYGQTSHSGSPSPHSHSTHSNTAVHTHSNPHTSPHGNAHGNPLASPNANTHSHTHITPTPHDTHHHNTQPHANLSSHTNTHPTSHLQSNPLTHSNPHTNNQPLHNAHTNPNTHLPSHTHSNPSPSLLSHSTPVLYEERSPPSTMTAHKRDLTPHAMSTGLCQGPLPHSPFPKPPLDSSPHQEDTSGFSLSHQSYQGMGHRYPSQVAQGGGVLCQLLDPANDDSFSVTSL